MEGKAMRWCLGVALLVLWSAGASAQTGPSPGPALAITHVTVIDATGAPARADQNVVIKDGRIVALGRSADTPVPADAEVVDGSRKFLIPGLWDMHAHVMAGARDSLALYLANGVTGVRDMHAYAPEMIFNLRQDIEAGKLSGPRIVACGAMIDGPNPTAGPTALVAADAAQGRAAVQSLKKRGADFIKIHSKVPRDAYFAIADEAKKQGLPFAGHVPESVGALETSDAGQRSIEHLTGLWISCSGDEAALRRETTEALRSGRPEDMALLFRVALKPADSFSEAKAQALYRRYVKNRTWQTPTLVMIRAFCSLDDPRFTADPRVKYISGFVRRFWDPKGPLIRSLVETTAGRKGIYRRSLEEVGKMHRAGVEILSGVDSPFPFCFPGFSVHDELALLVEAGLTPMEALQTATRNPARSLDRPADLGTVEMGKIADLVLLDANPLDDIKNTQKIAAVVSRGKLLDRTALGRMLADVEKRSSSSE
jgi:imidazolonepropionase-like amidohydrolase